MGKSVPAARTGVLLGVEGGAGHIFHGGIGCLSFGGDFSARLPVEHVPRFLYHIVG